MFLVTIKSLSTLKAGNRQTVKCTDYAQTKFYSSKEALQIIWNSNHSIIISLFYLFYAFLLQLSFPCLLLKIGYPRLFVGLLIPLIALSGMKGTFSRFVASAFKIHKFFGDNRYQNFYRRLHQIHNYFQVILQKNVINTFFCSSVRILHNIHK